MGESSEATAKDVVGGESKQQQQQGEEKAWHSYIYEDLPRTVIESTDSALRSARSLHLNSSTHIRTLQDLLPQLKSRYTTYEDAFFKKVKDELVSAREHSTVAGAVAITAGLLLMRGPRRFLFRHTLGRLQSEEAQIIRASKNVKELSLSVDLVKKESKKLLERAALAEKDLKHGQSGLMSTGRQIQSLGKSVYKVESEANDLMNVLREIPGREALKLRAEVASTASVLRDQRIAIDKRIMKITELGVTV